MYPYGQLFRPQMTPGMPAGFGYPPGMPPGVGAPGVPPPPGMPAPPGVPGMGPPGVPGMAQANLPTRPGMPGFVPPANLPNINFNAPIIRLGTSNTRTGSINIESRGGGSGTGGKGTDSGKGSTPIGFVRSTAAEDSLSPPTQEESLKTIYVGGIPKDFNDEWMERVLKAVARLRRWIRATDEEGRPCKFGFAEYEDIIGLECAIEVLEDLEIPAVDERKEAVKLMTVPDEKAPEYIKKYYETIETDESAKSVAVENARSEVESILSEYADPTKRIARSAEPSSSTDTNTPALDGTTPDGANGVKADDPTAPQPEIVTIPLSVDDELSDIPADMREMVAKEIAAFRERSNRRDMERLKREEEVERMERERMSAPRVSRLASPPISAPTGPSGGSNSIPIGPSRLREGAPASAPTAPSRMTGGSQIPRDYQKGVTFVNGTTASHGYWSKEEEESDADDEELEKRRKEKKAREQESTFLDHERRWLNRERSRTSALERETQRDKEDEVRQQKEKDAMAKRLAEWDDDVEASKKLEDYYVDRSLWIRNRTAFRQREIEMDERDKVAELRQAEMEKRAMAESAADRFLESAVEEMDRARKEREQPQQKFKLSLGAAAAAAKKAAADIAPAGRTRLRKTAAEVEGLLEDEEEDANKTKRVLIPIQYDASADQGVLDDEQRENLARQLAQEIPSDRKGLFEWNVAWEFVDEAMVKDKLQPFVEKKIVEYLGVQEQEVVGYVVGHIKKRGGAEDLVKELEMALDEDAEVMVKKVWRMLIFYSETEKRGLS